MLVILGTIGLIYSFSLFMCLLSDKILSLLLDKNVFFLCCNFFMLKKFDETIFDLYKLEDLKFRKNGKINCF